jgi:hypothetical protein
MRRMAQGGEAELVQPHVCTPIASHNPVTSELSVAIFLFFSRHLRRPRRSFLSPSRLLLSVSCASRARHVSLAAAGSEAPSEPGLSPGSGAASAPSTRVARREGETVDSTRGVRWEVGGIFTGSPHAPPRLTPTGVCTTYTSSPAPQSRGPVADVSKVSLFTAAESRPHAWLMAHTLSHAEGVEHCLTRAPHPDPCRSDFRGPRFLRPPFGRTHIPTNREPPESLLLLGR